jgi:hypothetical protein
MLKSSLAAAAILTLAVTMAQASPDDSPDQPGTLSTNLKNEITLQGGLLPGASILGVEYVRILHSYFEIAASASYGFTADGALTPRLRLPLRRQTSLAVGAGPSLAFDKGGVGETGRWYAQALVDLELTYVTVEHWCLQARMCDRRTRGHVNDNIALRRHRCRSRPLASQTSRGLF